MLLLKSLCNLATFYWFKAYDTYHLKISNIYKKSFRVFYYLILLLKLFVFYKAFYRFKAVKTYKFFKKCFQVFNS